MLHARRRILQVSGALGAMSALGTLATARAIAQDHAGHSPSSDSKVGTSFPAARNVGELEIAELKIDLDGRVGRAVAVNGSVPGPILRLREGEDAVIRVRNGLPEVSSIHWHGILLPPEMDGVPGVSFPGIAPGETFTYRFPVRQSGTYWAHSHSGGQELLGLYFPLVIDPIDPDPFQYDREHVLMLSDWSFESPTAIIAKLKKQAGYYNFQRRTLAELASDVRQRGWIDTMRERLGWARMRMDPTDLADVTGYTYTYLMNGATPRANWTALFKPGERLRLRLIDAGAMTYFDVRIPGLDMTVIQVDGQNVQPVAVSELRIAPGETYDVLVEPGDQAYCVFAETLDRSGYARATLAPRPGLIASVPARRRRALRSMTDMGMSMAGMTPVDAGSAPMANHGATDPVRPSPPPRTAGATATAAKSHADMVMPADSPVAGRSAESTRVAHGPDTHGPGNSVTPMEVYGRLDDPGIGLGNDNRKVLVYADIKGERPQPDDREPTREIELHITGNMERYSWSFNGKKYSQDSEPLRVRYGERFRLILINDTMMEHPIHLHGMWMELENGYGTYRPRKHTVNVKPAEKLSVSVTADALGRWAMHCHLLLHMEMGMFRVIEVTSAAG